MGAINLTRSQIETLTVLRTHIPEGGDLWLHSELESIYVDFQDAKSKTTAAFRIYENGKTERTHFYGDEVDDNE